MKEILAEFYSKVMCFFQAEKADNSKETATNRLKLVLMHDRTKLDPLTLEKMRSELVNVISKYVVIDKELLELNLEGEGDSVALMLNIPVIRAKTEEELILEAEETIDETEDENIEDSDESEVANDEQLGCDSTDNEVEIIVSDEEVCTEDEAITVAEEETELEVAIDSENSQLASATETQLKKKKK